MKKYAVPIALFSLLVFLLAFGWGVYLFLEESANSFLNLAQDIINPVKQEQWEKAKDSFAQSEKNWHKINKYWPMIIHHQEMDRIEESMSKLKGYLENEDKTEALAELNVLIRYIRHIPSKEAVNLQNIF
ncbi:MAG: DUF4363 family protein [Bacillota bacterium]|uniref:DUF4363 family protein n=1 Tax=Thermanaerosceptrum fracticalcis TaxID=1712410 RepID=A0A7G6E2R5_THEFR|nr:DUF4363 family protein [Thermanaerosceptrum fracticalcis]QNB46369.1 DUF4363 family protein [Thermanaerosceptrum fracticalcis]